MHTYGRMSGVFLSFKLQPIQHIVHVRLNVSGSDTYSICHASIRSPSVRFRCVLRLSRFDMRYQRTRFILPRTHGCTTVSLGASSAAGLSGAVWRGRLSAERLNESACESHLSASKISPIHSLEVIHSRWALQCLLALSSDTVC